jgi:hypothetical protein
MGFISTRTPTAMSELTCRTSLTCSPAKTLTSESAPASVPSFLANDGMMNGRLGGVNGESSRRRVVALNSMESRIAVLQFMILCLWACKPLSVKERSMASKGLYKGMKTSRSAMRPLAQTSFADFVERSQRHLCTIGFASIPQAQIQSDVSSLIGHPSRAPSRNHVVKTRL